MRPLGRLQCLTASKTQVVIGVAAVLTLYLPEQNVILLLQSLAIYRKRVESTEPQEKFVRCPFTGSLRKSRPTHRGTYGTCDCFACSRASLAPPPKKAQLRWASPSTGSIEGYFASRTNF